MPEGIVLIIEDDSTMLRGLTDNFAGRGYDVHSAMDGISGLDLAHSLQPDLIILDIMLPQLNGYGVCEEIRTLGLDMPIIMLTAKGQEKDIVRGLNAGADDYVTKPFSIAELLARANSFLRRRQGSKEQIIRFNDCELHLESHKFFRDGAEIELTPKEFGLLAFFCERGGRALTREVILNRVWSRNVLTTTRSVDRCVNTLRKKIENDQKNPLLIISVRDVGYRFDGCL